jgi:hypothetical protein
MASFVHITAAKYAAAIRRSGLGGVKHELMGSHLKRRDVYCFPVIESHTLTHQWTREIGKWRRQPLIGVYFRIPDDEQVGCWRFGKWPMKQMSAAEAVAAIRQHDDMRGFEVIVGRSIRADEITRITPVRNVIGWRHHPEARGKAPCACAICQKGQPDSRRIMAAAQEGRLQGWFMDQVRLKKAKK